MSEVKIAEAVEANPSIESFSSAVNPSEAGEDEFSFHELGIPLQASSPSIPTGLEGAGDGHSVRSVHNSLLSPIRRSFGTHQIATIETPPKTTPNFETFIAAIEKERKVDNSCSLQQELILTEKVGQMKEPDAKKLLAKVLIDNLGLRQELNSKEKRIIAYKGQMMAIMDWKAKQDSGEDESMPPIVKSSTSSAASRERQKINPRRLPSLITEEIGGEENHEGKERSGIHEVRIVEEVFGVRRSLSFFQEFAASFDVDQEQLRDKIKDGCFLTNQLLIGCLSGWMTAIFLKKFGKIALSAAGGGLLLLAYSTRKGYVNVNYDSIYEELSKLCDEDEEVNEDDDKAISESNSNWGLDKVKTAKKWISSHTYTVGGFMLTFMYNIL